jgi:hypothetical protein
MMRTTFVLTVDESLADFIYNQQGSVDPSAFVNKLVHDEMARLGKRPSRQSLANARDDVITGLEEYLDKDTPAAG